MASGKKDYFRHSFHALDDVKIQSIINQLGLEGYACYFILLELAAKSYAQNGKDAFEVHPQTLMKVWQKQHKSCQKVLTKLHESGLIVLTKVQLSDDKVTTKLQLSDHLVTTKLQLSYNFTVPNLLKYLGSYSKNSPKVKESKIKEIKENKTKLNKIKNNKKGENVVLPAIVVNAEVVDKPKDNKTRDFVKIYCDKFKQCYGTNPSILGKQAGIARRLSKEMSVEKFQIVVDAYFSMPDSWLVKSKHPLEAIEPRLNEITVWAEKQLFTTKTQANQKDAMVGNAMLLAKIESGEI